MNKIIKVPVLAISIALTVVLSACDDKKLDPVADVPPATSAPSAAEARVLAPPDRPMPKPKRSEPTSY